MFKIKFKKCKYYIAINYKSHCTVLYIYCLFLNNITTRLSCVVNNNIVTNQQKRNYLNQGIFFICKSLDEINIRIYYEHKCTF